LRIGIDAEPLSAPCAGIPRFVSNIVRELERIDHENLYYLYSRHDFALPFANIRWQKRIHPRVPVVLGSPYLRRDARRPGLDLFWATRSAFPVGLPPAVTRVLTVHDLVWRICPETMALRNHLVHRLLGSASLRRADWIMTVSEATRRGLVEVLGSRAERISVVYHGVDPSFAPQDKSGSARHIAQQYSASENYICTLGTIEPRKNLITLVRAMKILRERGDFPYQLLIGGQSGWRNAEIYASVRKCGLTEHEVKFVGPVREEDLPAFYSGSALFVFPSLYEGFGLPLVEAMACGVPIVASNVSSVPEVVRDAAVLVPPEHPEDFAQAIFRVASDSHLREDLVRKGLHRALDFRWETAAQKVLGAFIEISRLRAEVIG